MGACVVTIDDSGYEPVSAATGWNVAAKVHLSTTYATGGDTITPAQLGLDVVANMDCASAGGYLFRYDAANGKIQAYWTGAGLSAVLAEVTNGTNLSAINFQVWAQGR